MPQRGMFTDSRQSRRTGSMERCPSGANRESVGRNGESEPSDLLRHIFGSTCRARGDAGLRHEESTRAAVPEAQGLSGPSAGSTVRPKCWSSAVVAGDRLRRSAGKASGPSHVRTSRDYLVSTRIAPAGVVERGSPADQGTVTCCTALHVDGQYVPDVGDGADALCEFTSGPAAFGASPQALQARFRQLCGDRGVRRSSREMSGRPSSRPRAHRTSATSEDT